MTHVDRKKIVGSIKKYSFVYKILKSIRDFIFFNPIIGKVLWLKARYFHSKKEMKYEPCLCGKNTYKVYLDYKNNKVIACTSCGLNRNYPKPIHGIYSEDMSVEYEKNSELSIQVEHVCREIAEKESKNIFILDFGCGDGRTISFLKSLGFENVHGIEISKHLFEMAKEKGFQVFDDISKVPTTTKYDYMIANHVFEHIEKLDEELKNIKNILNPNAKIIIFVPNIRSKLMRNSHRNLLWDSHYWQFDPETFSNFFIKNGLTVEKCLTITDKLNKEVKILEPNKYGDEGDGVFITLINK